MAFLGTALAEVFSAHAEVVPDSTTPARISSGILRARGGSSGFDAYAFAYAMYSPRTRR